MLLWLLLVVGWIAAASPPADSFFADMDDTASRVCDGIVSRGVHSQLPEHTGPRVSPSFIVVPLSRPPTSNADDIMANVRISGLADGVLFDLDGDGLPEQVSWPEGTDVAFLAIDRNMNGAIDNGTELFGAQTLPGAANDGFAALARLCPNDGDGSITQDDEIYSRLLLWSDHDRNGQSTNTEIAEASKTLAKIGLGYFSFDRLDAHRNRFKNRGWAVLVQDFKNRAADPILPLVEVSPAFGRSER